MTSLLIVFVDLGGVIIDKDQQITQWQGLVGECFVRLLGGTHEAWTLAHRLVTNRLEKREQAHSQPPVDFVGFYRSYPAEALVVDDSPQAINWAAQTGAKTVLVSTASHPERVGIPHMNGEKRRLDSRCLNSTRSLSIAVRR